MELIKLPINLGLEIVKKLKEFNIEPRKETEGPFKGNLSLKFTEEELSLIEELSFINPTHCCLDGIEYLTNLKKLEISTYGDTAYNRDAASITDKDIAKIANLKTLESLTINNQAKISWVYLDKLTNLKNLTITKNTSLEEVSGLNKLNKLEEFIEYGNKDLYKITGLNEMIEQNDLEVFETDLMHYDEIQFSKQKLSNIVNCDFSEKITQDEINYSLYQLSIFHKKCLEIAEKAQLFNSDKRSQIVFVENYLAQNIKYDTEALNQEKRVHYEDGKRKGKNYGTNSAYNGIMFGSAVCEGYTRSMQYILKLMGIKTKNVNCISGANKIQINESYHNQVTLPDDGYHSIIRIDDDNYIYYCDPCWDSCHFHRGDESLPYCLLTKQEMSKDHTMSFEEKNISYDIKYPRKNISYIINNINETLENNQNENSFHR